LKLGFNDFYEQFNLAKNEILYFARINSVSHSPLNQVREKSPLSKIVKFSNLRKKNISTLCSNLPLTVRDALFIGRNYEGTIKDLVADRNSTKDGVSELFWSNYYLAMYEDLPKLNFDPWLHFLEFGLYEDRTPHPYLDIKALGAQLEKKYQIPTLLQYLIDPQSWGVLPNRWMDLMTWIEDEEYTGEANPLVSLLNSNKRNSYVSPSLIQIEASGSEYSEVLDLGHAYFASTSNFHMSESGLSVSQVIAHSSKSYLESCGAVVIPGFGILYDNKKALCFGNKVSDSHQSSIRAGNLVVSRKLNPLPFVDVNKCIILGKHLFKNELLSIISKHGADDTCFVPQSDFQADAIQNLLENAMITAQIIRRPTRINQSFEAINEPFSNVEMPHKEISAPLNSLVHLLIQEQNLTKDVLNCVQKHFPNVSLMVYTNYNSKIANVLLSIESVIVASELTLEMYSGVLDYFKVIELETLLQL